LVNLFIDELEEDDIDFIQEGLANYEGRLDVEDTLAYIYGRLLELGYEPDELFIIRGVITT